VRDDDGPGRKAKSLGESLRGGSLAPRAEGGGNSGQDLFLSDDLGTNQEISPDVEGGGVLLCGINCQDKETTHLRPPTGGGDWALDWPDRRTNEIA